MSSKRATVKGFWSAAFAHRRQILKGLDLWLSLATAILAILIVDDKHASLTLGPLATAELGVAAALFGIILAGLAIIVVFLDEQYLDVLAQAPGGVEADFFPFWFTAGLAVLTIIFDAAVIILSSMMSDPKQGTPVPAPFARFFLGGLVWFFMWTLLPALSLVAFVAGHGVNRSIQILSSKEKSANRREQQRS